MAEIIRDATYCEHTGRKLTPKVVGCACGRSVECWSSWANACQCGREFNGSGQELAPREQWGEETGETAADLHFLDTADEGGMEPEIIEWEDE